MGRQSLWIGLNETNRTRRIAPNAATFVHEAKNAVTGVGAPW
jgi:hypothetical protein